MNNLVSIIVPVYNVAPYLTRCVDSILRQTHEAIEIILVDDGSTDTSGSICDAYEKTDTRIKTIHKQNGGLSDARNAGIKIASGEYLAFVDSDDYISEQYVSELLTACVNNHAEIAVCNLIKTNQTTDQSFTGTTDTTLITGFDALVKNYGAEAERFIVAWNKLYKRELFHEVRYPYGKIMEDVYTTYKLFYQANTVAVIDAVLYAYYQSDSSIMRSRYSVKRLDILSSHKERLDFFKAHNESILYTLQLRCYFNWLLHSYLSVAAYCNNIPQTQTILASIKHEIKQSYQELKHIRTFHDLTNTQNILCRGKLFLGRYFRWAYRLIFFR